MIILFVNVTVLQNYWKLLRGGNVILAYSKKIRDEYATYLDKMPDDVVELLEHIMSK